VKIQRRRYAIIVTKNGASLQKVQKIHAWNYLIKKEFCKDCKMNQDTETENSEEGNDTKQSGSLQLPKNDPDVINKSMIQEGRKQEAEKKKSKYITYIKS
jgi:hypothetical protein